MAKKKHEVLYKDFCKIRDEMCQSCPNYTTCPASPTCFSLLLKRLGFKFKRPKKREKHHA